jgi:hypothetical protein
MQLSAIGGGRVHMRISLIAGFVASIAAIVPSAKAGSSYDGAWTVTLFTKSGTCEPSYQARGYISNGIVSFAGANSTNFSGRVTPNGALTVSVSGGVGWGVGAGRLSANSGSGSWRAKVESGVCTGVWSAQRG